MVAYIPILIPILLFSSPLLVAAIIVCVKNCVKKRKYKKYLDSIKVGDVFVNEHKMNLTATNPFKKINPQDYYDVITEIKKNYRGITWVKYVDANKTTHEEEISTFVNHHKRVDVAGELMNKK